MLSVEEYLTVLILMCLVIICMMVHVFYVKDNCITMHKENVANDENAIKKKKVVVQKQVKYKTPEDIKSIGNMDNSINDIDSVLLA
jgi:hypothetical protein